MRLSVMSGLVFACAAATAAAQTTRTASRFSVHRHIAANSHDGWMRRRWGVDQ